MSGTDDIRQWATDDRTQAEAIRWFVAVGTAGAKGNLSKAQADTLDATADGWDALAAAVDG